MNIWYTEVDTPAANHTLIRATIFNCVIAIRTVLDLYIIINSPSPSLIFWQETLSLFDTRNSFCISAARFSFDFQSWPTATSSTISLSEAVEALWVLDLSLSLSLCGSLPFILIHVLELNLWGFLLRYGALSQCYFRTLILCALVPCRIEQTIFSLVLHLRW